MQNIKATMHRLIDDNFDELVDSLQQLLRLDSVLEEDKMSVKHPFGVKLTHVLDTFLKLAAHKGFAIKNVANSAGHAEMGSSGELIGILAHLDVMPVGSIERWNHDPFGAEIEDGKLYGRGASDDKGPAIAALYAMIALRGCGVALNKRYRLIVGLDEESGSRCLRRYLQTEEIPVYSFSPDAYFPVINAEKGILHFDISKSFSKSSIDKIVAGDRYNMVPDEATAYMGGQVLTARGVSAHAMEPSKGKNALQILLQQLAPMDKEAAIAHELVGMLSDGSQLGINCADDISGELTCNAAAIRWGNGSYIMKFDVRYPVTVDSAFVIGSIENVVSEVGATLHIREDKAPLHLPADLPFIQLLLKAYSDVTGEKGEAFSIGGGTYCRFLANSVSFGATFPDEEEVAHQPDEYIALESLRKAAHIYAEALYLINRM